MGLHQKKIFSKKTLKKIMACSAAKVSIIIPVFNAVNTIKNVIDSVLNQTYPAKELVVIDNLSTDGTTEILKSYGNLINILITEKDNGIYDAMNKAIAHCSGDWLFFLGADDAFYDNDVLTNIFSKGNFKDHEIIYGNAYYIHRQKVRFGKMNKYKLAKHNFNHQTVFYPTQVFDIFRYDTKYKLWADYYLNIQLYFKSNFQFTYVDTIVSQFNDKGSSGSQDDQAFLADRNRILNAILPFDALAFYYGRGLFIKFRDFLRGGRR
jgi:glycosyltransferase involved in cell wall biosynthesis